MIFLIDIGNSMIKWKLINNNKIIIYNQYDIKDFECKLLPNNKEIKCIYIANVNHDKYSKLIIDWYKKHPCKIQVITERTHPNLQNNYDEKDKLGIDRWLNALGAWKYYNQSVFIISAGTAITIDYVEVIKNQIASYQGGIILPGLHTLLNSLNHTTAKVNASISENIRYPAKSTNDSVSTGITFAIVGAVNQVCRTQSVSVPIVITGGDAMWILNHAEDSWRSRITINENLIFEGMLAYS